MIRVWEVCFEMQHHGWRRMKIYKSWFSRLVLHMHNNWKWHGMTKLGIGNLLRQVKQRSWKPYWIWMNPKWFMGGKKKNIIYIFFGPFCLVRLSLHTICWVLLSFSFFWTSHFVNFGPLICYRQLIFLHWVF